MKLNVITALLLASMVFVACSNDDDDTSAEYYNWQARNDAYFEQKFQEASEYIAAGREDWYKILSYSKNNADKHTNYIIVNVLEQSKESHKEVIDGTKNTTNGLRCPIVGDTCTITYRGNLIPSKSYSTIASPDNIEVGYQFDTKWYGSSLILSEALYSPLTPNAVVDGFSTALQYMHPGDRWRVYIPYDLGYGSSSKDKVQAYSTLIFDIYMKSFKTKQKSSEEKQ